MWPFSPLRRSDPVGATDQKRHAGHRPHSVLGLIAVGVVAGCAGARYERGVSAFDEATAPVHLVAADAADSERVRAVITVRAGSAHDPVGYAGLAWTTAQAIADRGEAAMTAVDGRVTADVGKELVSFHLEAPATAETALADTVKTMFDLSGLSEADLAESKAVGVQWLTDGLASDTRRLADAAFERWVFEGHPYAMPVEGRVSGLASVDAGDVQRFKTARYVRPAISVEVRGAQQAQVIQEALSAAPARLYVDVTPRPVAPVKQHGILIVQHDLPATGLVLGHPLRLRPGHPDWVALAVGLTSLSSDPGAAMVDLLTREDAAFSIRLVSDQPQAGAALFDAGMSRASAFVANGLNPSELTETKAALTASLESSAALGAVSRSRLMGRAAPQELADAIRATTLDQVNAALAAHIDPGALRVVLVGRPDAFDGLTFETAHTTAGAGLFE